MDAREFGRFIAARRVELGLTQAELAETLNVTNKAISKWENGRGLPDIDNVECLAGALKLSLQELMECCVDGSEGQKGGAEEALQETLDFAQIKIKKAIHMCIPTLILAWGLMIALIYVMCMYMDMDMGQHLELRAILIGFLTMEVGLTGNVLHALVRDD